MKRIIIGVPFEWDDEKNQINIRKHGVCFEDAIMVFNDDNRIELYDEAHSSFEDRFAVIGIANRLLFVNYTVRKNVYRIISARIANKKEKKLYYGNNKSYS